MSKDPPKKTTARTSPAKAKRRPAEILCTCACATHDPHDNSIGGPNDYAYGM